MEQFKHFVLGNRVHIWLHDGRTGIASCLGLKLTLEPTMYLLKKNFPLLVAVAPTPADSVRL